MALQHGPDASGLFDTIYQEILRKATTVASGAWSGCSFPPFNTQPESALGRGFVRRLTRLGAAYWTGWPSAETLLCHGVGGVKSGAP